MEVLACGIVVVNSPPDSTGVMGTGFLFSLIHMLKSQFHTLIPINIAHNHPSGMACRKDDSDNENVKPVEVLIVRPFQPVFLFLVWGFPWQVDAGGDLATKKPCTQNTAVREFLSDAHFLDLVTERKSMIHNTMRGGAGHGESMCGAKVTFQARIWRELDDQTQKMAVSYRKQKLHLFSWRVFLLLLLASNSDPLCFSAHSGSNLLPESGMILDAGSLIAMVVKGSGGDQRPTLWRSNGNCTASECHC